MNIFIDYPSDVLRYLNGPYRQGNFEHKSAYMSALIDARISTGRDENTGKIINQKIIGNWAGALVYLVLIDHIGSLFRKNNQSNIDNRSFINALKNFTELTEKEIYALYALRCSFAHEYFLFNIFKGKNKKEKILLTHHFTVTTGSESLITLPLKNWEGLFNEMNDRVTVVNLEKLGNLVEEIHIKLIELVKNNNLEVIAGKEHSMIVNYVGYSI